MWENCVRVFWSDLKASVSGGTSLPYSTFIPPCYIYSTSLESSYLFFKVQFEDDQFSLAFQAPLISPVNLDFFLLLLAS